MNQIKDTQGNIQESIFIERLFQLLEKQQNNLVSSAQILEELCLIFCEAPVVCDDHGLEVVLILGIALFLDKSDKVLY